MNLLWKKKECTWINTWNPGWTKKMYYGNVEDLFTNLTPLQRSLLGVPMPGDKYWTIQKIELLNKVKTNNKTKSNSQTTTKNTWNHHNKNNIIR